MGPRFYSPVSHQSDHSITKDDHNHSRDVLAQSDQALAGEGPWPRAVQVLLQIWPLSSNCLHGCRLNLILLIGKSERFVLDNHFYCFNIKQFNDFKKIHTSIIIATLGMFSENE